LASQSPLIFTAQFVEKYEISVDKPRLLWITSRIENGAHPIYGGRCFNRAKIWRW
jgi:hypothetical protein